MLKFRKWLSTEISLLDVFINILLIDILVMLFFGFLYPRILPEMPVNEGMNDLIETIFVPINQLPTVLLHDSAFLIREDLLSVLLPFSIALIVGRIFHPRRFSLIMTAGIISSVIFGYAHGGWLFVPIQGLMRLATYLYFMRYVNTKPYWPVTKAMFYGMIPIGLEHLAFDYGLVLIYYIRNFIL